MGWISATVFHFALISSGQALVFLLYIGIENAAVFYSHLIPSTELTKQKNSIILHYISNVVLSGEEMKIDFESIKPIYTQIAEAIEDDIVIGNLQEGEAAYSQLVLSRELGVNPATAAKGIYVLVQKGILEKQRGQSMTVACGARTRLISERRENSFANLTRDFIAEAIKLDLSEEKLVATVKELYDKMKEGCSRA